MYCQWAKLVPNQCTEMPIWYVFRHDCAVACGAWCQASNDANSNCVHAVLCRCYVVGKDVAKRVVYVTDGEAGQNHPALLSNTALLHSPQWVAGHAPEQLKSGLPLPCSFKARLALLAKPPPFPLPLPLHPA